MSSTTYDEMVEALANLEHSRWSHWMKYMLENFTADNLARWRRQMMTPYLELSEKEKESDRQEVYKTLELLILINCAPPPLPMPPHLHRSPVE